MNNKIIALFIVCIAMVAAAGCMGFPTAGVDPSSTSQDISNGRLQSESKMAYPGDALPCQCQRALHRNQVRVHPGSRRRSSKLPS